MKKLLLFLLLSISVYAQTIKGTITDDTGIVPFTNILIKKTESPHLIFQFTSADANGFYQLQLKEKPELLLVEFTSPFHRTKTILLKNFIFKSNEIEVNTKLETSITTLKEIILERKIAIKVKKDTITYDPKSFIDGTERVVEDLLRKLPGVEVKEDGEIKYKGKSIKKLLLDGDDLFAAQYKIGSKNINVAMIDKVQGIDNYQENTLLKGVTDSDDVVLNLILKKGKTNLSGDVNVGYGYKSKLENSFSTVLVNSKTKGFGIASFNNLGTNKSPYEVESDFKSYDRKNEKHAKTLLNQGNFFSILHSELHTLNNNFYTSGNVLFKINKKSSLKFNLGYYSDKINRINENNSTFIIDTERFTVLETNKIVKKPILYDAKIYFSNKEKTNFHWNYASDFNFSKTNFADSSINNFRKQENEVHTENLFIKQNLDATYKLSDKTVLISKIEYSLSNAPQNLNSQPGTVIDFDNSIISQKQESQFDSELINIKSLIFSKKDSIKYAISTEYLRTSTKLFSALYDVDNNILGNQYKNDNNYKVNLFSLKPIFTLNKTHYSFKIAINTLLYKIEFKDFINNSVNANEFIITPEFYFNYKLNRKAKLSASYQYHAILPEEDKLFSGIIQNDYRSFSSNTLSLEFLQTHSYTFEYAYNDFFNFKKLHINIKHNYKPNNYFYDSSINQNITVNNLFLASLSTKDYNLNLFGEIYFHPLKTTFQLNGNYMLFFNKNIINNSEIRDIKGNALLLYLTARAGLTTKITMENNISFEENKFRVTGKLAILQNLSNKTKIVYSPNKEIKIIGIASLISPNLKQDNNYIFLESGINYSPLNKKYSYSLISKNLTNNKYFETTNISDFSTSTSSHSLIERYIILKVYYSF